MASSVKVQVKGLKEFRKELKAIDNDLPKAMRVALNKSAEIVIDEARPKVPKKTGRAASTVKARSTQTAARVVGGGNKAPYYGWLDFGGWGGRNKKVHRPFYKEGRYIYAAYYRHADDFRKVLEASLVDVAKQAGMEVT